MLSEALRTNARLKNRTVVQGSATPPGNLGIYGCGGSTESVSYNLIRTPAGSTLSSSTNTRRTYRLAPSAGDVNILSTVKLMSTFTA